MSHHFGILGRERWRHLLKFHCTSLWAYLSPLFQLIGEVLRRIQAFRCPAMHPDRTNLGISNVISALLDDQPWMLPQIPTLLKEPQSPIFPPRPPVPVSEWLEATLSALVWRASPRWWWGALLNLTDTPPSQCMIANGGSSLSGAKSLDQILLDYHPYTSRLPDSSRHDQELQPDDHCRLPYHDHQHAGESNQKLSGRWASDHQPHQLVRDGKITVPPPHTYSWGLALILHVLHFEPFKPPSLPSPWLPWDLRRDVLSVHAFYLRVQHPQDWSGITLIPDPIFTAKTERADPTETTLQDVHLRVLHRSVDANNCVVCALKIFPCSI